jgi:hypothetical protein
MSKVNKQKVLDGLAGEQKLEELSLEVGHRQLIELYFGMVL